MVLINIVLVIATIHVIKNPPPPKYFAVSADGRMTALHPLSAPVLSLSSVTEWAARAATSAYTFDFVNYRKELTESSAFFTPAGWAAFENALVSSRNLELVLSKKLVTTAVAQGAPVVLKRGVLGQDSRSATSIKASGRSTSSFIRSTRLVPPPRYLACSCSCTASKACCLVLASI